jgi:hypothetical protein
VLEDVPTATDLLDAWRDAVRAAQLTERLADIAAEAVARTEADALAAEEVAVLAEAAAYSAEAAAAKARATSERARAAAEVALNRGHAEARTSWERALAAERGARERYHQADSDLPG